MPGLLGSVLFAITLPGPYILPSGTVYKLMIFQDYRTVSFSVFEIPFQTPWKRTYGELAVNSIVRDHALTVHYLRRYHWT